MRGALGRYCIGAQQSLSDITTLARKWERLVIKVPDSAGSQGNFIVNSHDVLHVSLKDLYNNLQKMLPNHGRGPGFPVLIEVWDVNVLTSPSAQVWIPLPDQGPPEIEGLFEQILTGEEAAFSGAVLADLPDQLDQVLCHGAMQLATLFQQLGFYGRCSFDALVSGSNDDQAAIHWIECNARWGGASIPMSLVNRLALSGRVPSYAIVQESSDLFAPVSFTDALNGFADLTDTRELQTGVIFLTPNLMEAGTGAHFLSFGTDTQGATDQARQVLHRLKHPNRQSKSAIPN